MEWVGVCGLLQLCEICLPPQIMNKDLYDPLFLLPLTSVLLSFSYVLFFFSSLFKFYTPETEQVFIGALSGSNGHPPFLKQQFRSFEVGLSGKSSEQLICYLS